MLGTNHKQSIVQRGKITVNHNQTVARPKPGLSYNHNQTVLFAGNTWPNHNQTVVRTPTVKPQHNQTVVRR